MMRQWLTGMALLTVPMTAFAEESVITDMAKPNWSFHGDVKVTEVDAANVPGGKMLRLDIFRKGKNYWDSAATSAPVKAIAKDQIVTLGFFARSASGDQSAWVNANVGEIAAPYDTAIIARIDLDPQTQFYCLEGPAKLRLGASKAKVTLHVGGEKQKIDLGPYIVTVRDADDGPSQLPCTKIVRSW